MKTPVYIYIYIYIYIYVCRFILLERRVLRNKGNVQSSQTEQYFIKFLKYININMG